MIELIGIFTLFLIASWCIDKHQHAERLDL
jgi:hypothetical protein